MATIDIKHLAKVSQAQFVCGREFAELLVLQEGCPLIVGDIVSKGT